MGRLPSTTPSLPSPEDLTSWNPSNFTRASAPSLKPDTTLPEVPSPLRRPRMRRRELSSSTSTTKSTTLTCNWQSKYGTRGFILYVKRFFLNLNSEKKFSKSTKKKKKKK